MTASYLEIKEHLLDAAVDHVPFDGWSEVTFQAATDAAADIRAKGGSSPSKRAHSELSPHPTLFGGMIIFWINFRTPILIQPKYWR